jgi:ferredoxin
MDKSIRNKSFNWKQARRFFSVAFFLMTCLSVWFVFPDIWSKQIVTFQLGPALIRLATERADWTLAGLLTLAVIIVVLGRTYCSTICPLGFLQDVVIWLGQKCRIKYQWEIGKKKTLKVFRISISVATVSLLIFGSAFAAGLLDPFSIFSRFVFTLNIFSQGMFEGDAMPILFIWSIILLIAFAAIKKGRFFCSWVCPVGTMFWGLSGFSLFKFRVDKSVCNHCGKCVESCKSGAISNDTEIIDQALCVGCFNCMSVCSQSAIKIFPKISKKGDVKVSKDDAEMKANRRKFIKQFGSVLLVTGMPVNTFAGSQLKDIFTENDWRRVFPLGAKDLYRFKNQCTGCMVCANKCPSKIIFPSMGTLNGSPILPTLNFQKNYCLEDCVACSQACPTGALQEVAPEDKKITKIAFLELNLTHCRIVAEGLECDICAEICPLNAIEMKQVAGHESHVPAVIQDICNGCGKCLYRCPVKEREDIFRFSSFYN